VARKVNERMAGDLLLGIDLGTTFLKVAVIDAGNGGIAASAAVALSVRTESDGTREQSAAAVGCALNQAVRKVRAGVGGAWNRVAGVGLAAQGGSAIIADRKTGRALTPIQLWNDTRPLQLLPAIAKRRPEGLWRRLSYLPGPGAGLARIEWLRRKRPELFCEGNIYVGAGEYVYFRLTGAWRQDAGNALQIGCYDAGRRRLSAWPLRLVGVEASFVAPMRSGHQTHPLSAAGARHLHLPAGLPVAGPYIDHEAGYLSALGASPRPMQCSLGTAWVANSVLETASPPSSGFNLVLPSPVRDGSLLLRVMAAGNASWDWALGALAHADPSSALRRADAVFRRRLLPPDGLVALPWLTRPNPITPGAAGAGGFLGVNTHTTAEELLRAVVAGMCFEFARVTRPVLQAGEVDGVVLAGGASKGWFFRKILTGLFWPLPVFHTQDDVAGARGAIYAFSRKAARCKTSRQGRPDKALRAELGRRLDEYCRMCDVLARGLDGGAMFLDTHEKGEKR